ncbi:MAG: hypothetical protein ACRCV0_04545 [Brevinema sp.]
MNKLLIVFLLLLFPIQITNAQVRKKMRKIVHRAGGSLSFLVQNSPLQEIVILDNTTSALYAAQSNIWKTGSTGLGFALDFFYDLTLPNNFMTRFQTGFDTTGGFLWIIEAGIGIRTPFLRRKIFVSFEVYFTTAQTFAKIPFIGLPIPNIENEKDVYVGFFGFKGRLALEFPITKKFYMGTFVSYAVYPWNTHNSPHEVFLNGLRSGVIIDSLKIGLEFGFKSS